MSTSRVLSTTRGLLLAPDPQVVKNWQSFIRTPTKSQSPASGTNAREAVTLDCEMAAVETGSEVVHLSVVDYLTGEVLIYSLVRTMERVTDWRTPWSGVTRGAMADAISRGEALDGLRGARAELFKYIDAETVLIGHGLHHDLNELKVLHPRVVDSAVLAQNAVGMARQWGLKSLCTGM